METLAWRKKVNGEAETDEHIEDPPAEIENDLNSAQLSQACEGVNLPITEAAFRMPGPNPG